MAKLEVILHDLCIGPTSAGVKLQSTLEIELNINVDVF